MTTDRDLERALQRWATPGSLEGAGDSAGESAGDPAGDSGALARILSHADRISREPLPDRRSPRRWLPFAMGGGALAASIAAGLLVMPASPPTLPRVALQPGVQTAAASDPEMDSFALLYTVTDEEEQYL